MRLLLLQVQWLLSTAGRSASGHVNKDPVQWRATVTNSSDLGRIVDERVRALTNRLLKNAP
jgi:hypothetical protein